MSGLHRVARRLRAAEGGFTLVELVVSMTILLVILTGVSVLFEGAARGQADLDRRFQAQTQLRVGLDKLVREVHRACAATASSSTSVTLTEPPSCGTTITWCTQGSGTRYGLYRVAGASCSGGMLWTDYLTTGGVFQYYPPNTPTGTWSLARLHVDLPVNVDGSGPGTYELRDDIVFRNSARQ